MITLVVQRLIRATPERLFDAWTLPEQLQQWWGPQSVSCVGAEVDLRVGGRYRIGNLLPDGNVVWIVGHFELIERPRLLAFTWQIEGRQAQPERVTVTFDAVPDGTRVVVTHERIADESTRNQHEHGWEGCLDGLAGHVAAANR